MSTTEKGLIWLAGPESEIVEVSGWLEGIGFDVVVAADAPKSRRWRAMGRLCLSASRRYNSDQIREIDRARTIPSNPPIIVLGNERELSQRLEDRIDVVFLESTTSQEHFLSTFCEGLTKIVSNSKRLSSFPFETIFREAPQAMVLVDNDGNVIFSNRSFDRLSGRANEPIMLPFLDLLDGLEQTHVCAGRGAREEIKVGLRPP